MALAAKPVMQHNHHHPKRYATATAVSDVKRAANMYMNKLTDRDTEAMAASELDSMARSLPADSIPSFLSAISDTRSSDKTPLRRHCVRLLSLLSQSHPPHSLSPLIPRMVSAVRSRLRDVDSSVRSACVDAVRSIASAAASSPSSSGGVVFRPLCESLLLEQDHNAQIGSAMCLAAAVEELGFEISADVQRLVPRLVKLAKSEAFKAKPALLSLFGSVIAAGGASTPATLGVLVPCLIDFLGSEDWATRKAAAEALSRVASISDAHLLANFKSSCISSYESHRFDKVKIVRDSMNQMLEAWKNLPGSVRDDDDDGGVVNDAPNLQGNTSLRESASRDRFPASARISSSVKSNNNYHGGSATINISSASSRSPPPEASPVRTTTRKNPSPSIGRRTSPPMFRKLDHKKPSNWKVEISIPETQAHKVLHEDKQSGNGNNAKSRFKPKQVLFEDISEDKVSKYSNSKVTAHEIPVQEKESSLSATGTSNATDDLYIIHKENNDLSLIRNQLAQIERQQSSLLDLLQRFIGSSQNGIRSLETRVHGLEMALDVISQDLAVSTGKTSDPSANACCKLPGAEFLSSKFWRRTEGRYSSRLPISSTSALAGVRNLADKESMDSFKWDRRQNGIQGGFIVNPLAEVNSQSRSGSDASSRRPLKGVMPDAGPSSAHDGSRST